MFVGPPLSALPQMGVPNLTEELRRDLLRYLCKTSAERARVIREITERNPSMAKLLMHLEADYDFRTQFEIELLRRSS